MTMQATLTVDFDANAAYLRVSEATIVETCEVAPGVLVDLDEFRCAVGIEVLDLSIDLPVARIEREFHLKKEDAHRLASLSPNVTTFVARQGGINVAAGERAGWETLEVHRPPASPTVPEQ